MRTRLVLLSLLGACGPGDDGPAGGDCEGILAGELVITEVFGDYAAPPGGSGADEGKEWFELYNATGAPIDLEGVTIVHARPDGASERVHVMATVTVAAGDYLVLGNVLPEFVAGHLDYGYADELGELFNTNGGKLSVRCGDTVVDEALYDEVASGQASGFDGGAAPDYTANDDLALWCTAPEDAAFEYEPANFGTPGAANVDCVGGTPGMCDDGGTLRPTVPPVPGDLAITEVHPNPSGDDAAEEWFEVHAINGGFDLNGLALDRAGDSRDPDVVAADACLTVTAGTYLVFGKTAETAANGMLPRVDGIFGFAMVDSGDVRILDPGGATLDAVTWTNAGDARTRQVDPDFADPGANDAENAWCDATTAWAGADRGSPGAANEECTILPPDGMCMDGDTVRPIVSPTAGQLVISEWMPNPALVDDAQGEWFEVRATAPIDLNGLQAGVAALGANPIVTAVECVELAAGEHALLARNAVTESNGMLPAVDGTFGFGLVNSNSTLRIGVGGVELDDVAWASSTSGASIQIDTDGTQCDAPAGTAAYNGTDVGTPRAIHTVECP